MKIEKKKRVSLKYAVEKKYRICFYFIFFIKIKWLLPNHKWAKYKF